VYQCWTLKSPARVCLQRSCQGSMPHSLIWESHPLSLAALALTLRNLTIRIPARHPAPLLLVGAVGGFRGANMDHGGLVRVDTLPAVEMIKQTYRRRRRRQQHGIDLIVLEYAEKPIDVF